MSKIWNKRFYFFGFLGFLGLLGFKYFSTGNPGDLFYFANFAFFAVFILRGIKYEHQDERWIANSKRASTIALWMAMASIFLIGIISSWVPVSREFVIVACAAGWTFSIFAYAIAFRVLERS